MRQVLCLALLVLSPLAMLAQGRPSASSHASVPSAVLKGARKLLVVTTPGWNEAGGTLRRFDRANGRWQPQGPSIVVVVGRNGMGWDPGLHEARAHDAAAPVKREGDGRSPAGAFRLEQVFGYASGWPGLTRYLHLTADTECVDDPASRYYGQVLERRAVKSVDWKSSERMRRDDDLYRLGIVVDYNRSAVTPGAGSCIFLHIWRGAGQGTAGCTAMAPDDLTALVGWLGDRAPAVLVQLPAPEYERLRTAWNLPPATSR